MRRQFRIIFATVACLLAIDVAVALFLTTVAPQSLVQFFEYGRSVPGKLAVWRANPDMKGNLQDVAWLPDLIAESTESFESEPQDQPVVRGYGMSFVHQILAAATKADPALKVDDIGGPAAAPNFTYAAFLEDRKNRRPGDVVVLGLLSSSTPDMASFSNSSWAFEQPAPFTAPIFLPEGEAGLKRLDPLVQSRADQAALLTDPEALRNWRTQLRAEDRIYTSASTALPWLDISPLARLIRRSLAIGRIQSHEARVIANPEGDPYPYSIALRRMVRAFADQVRQDGQVPVVMIVQSRDPADPPLAEILRPTLEANRIPYFASVDHQSPRDPAAFMGDGHYRSHVNAVFGQAFADLPAVRKAMHGE